MALEQYVSWSEIDSLIELLSNSILKSKKEFSSISTISRGGLVPSRLLADYLGIKKIFVDEKIISSDSIFVDDILILVKLSIKLFQNLRIFQNYFMLLCLQGVEKNSLHN